MSRDKTIALKKADKGRTSVIRQALKQLLRDKTIALKKADKGTTSVIRQALKQLLRDKTIALKKADKGTTSVMTSKEGKINEGLALLKKRRTSINPSLNLWLKPQPEKLRS